MSQTLAEISLDERISKSSERRLEEAVARLGRDLDNLRDAVGLLGIKPCSWCKKFFRTSDAGRLFDGGELVCYGCIHDWWPHRRGELSVENREIVEQKLVRWLQRHHEAQVIPQSAKLSEDQLHDFRTVVTCHECGGTGKLVGQRCRFCDGRGTALVLTPATEA